MELSERQAVLLRKVVEGHVALGAPVGSKWLAERAGLPFGPSTIRSELARLEELGLLDHPHTSAGRVPTGQGYRFYADELLADNRLPAPRPPTGVGTVQREIDAAVRQTSEQLSQVTNLLAIVSAPPIGTTTIRHVEVLALQPQVVMVVTITSTGGVTKRLFSFERPVDRGLVDWARAYVNERLVGTGLGARMLHNRLADPGLNATEREFVAAIEPAFTDLERTAGDSLYVEGTARLLSEDRMQELTQIEELLELLERRVTLLRLLKQALAEPRVFVRIGEENEAPALHEVSIVAAGYGTVQRSLGAVGVLGPVRMDYATAIGSVRQAADELSRVVGELYE